MVGSTAVRGKIVARGSANQALAHLQRTDGSYHG